MAGTAKKPKTKKTTVKKVVKESKQALEPCDKAQAAESSRPMQEDGACDDGVH
jgi:hypothetical protein